MIRLARAAPTTAFAGVLTALLLSTSGCRQPDDIDIIIPYVGFNSPSEGNVLDDIATIRVEARDNVGIKQVVFMAEGDTLASLTTEPDDFYEFYWNTTAYPDCTGADSFVLLMASAEDFAGNSRSTHRKFYLDNEGLPPIPVELFTPTNVTKHSVTLSWEQSVDYDFSHYILRRGVTDSVTTSSDSLVRSEDPEATRFTDQDTSVSPFGLLEDTDYYYRIWVYDSLGASSASDSVVSVRTLLPRPVTLSATSTLTKYTIGLEWEANAEDVAYYRLHRGTSRQMAALDSIAGLSESTHSYLDAGRTAKTTYYYYLYLFDEAGYTHTFRSDDVLEVRTLALPPPVLEETRDITKYTATIAWATIEEQEDSSWVALYRSSDASVDTNDVRIYKDKINAALTHFDRPLQQDRTYHYRMRHRDSGDNTAWSNTLTLTTQSLDDVWSGGLGVSSQGKYQLGLTWDRYSYSPAADFAGYTLSRDGQEVFTSSNADDNRHTDTGLSKNTPYRYRLEVADTSGATEAVTLDASTRDIFPAEIIRLEADSLWRFELEWLSSEELSPEFLRYLLLRSADSTETFTDLDGDNQADCLSSSNCVQVYATTQQQPLSGTTLSYTDNDPALIDTTLPELPVYNYVVLTYDVAGEFAPSNIVGDILYSPPAPVMLSAPADSATDVTIYVEWTRATWPLPGLANLLFSRYEVWRDHRRDGPLPGDEGTSYHRVASITGIGETTFTDADDEIKGGSPFSYVVMVRDIYGQASVSNKVEAGTNP